jgi:hypothetical protein
MADDSTGRRRVYGADEVNAILARAAAPHPKTDGLTLDEILEVAREAGISAEAVAAAAQTHDAEAAHARRLARAKKRARRGFAQHLAWYVLVNAFLVAVNLLAGGPLWFFWPMLGWGLGVVSHAFGLFFGDDAALARAEAKREERALRRYEREREREAKERTRAARKRARKEQKEALEASAHAFQEAAVRGVSTLLASTARRIEEHVEPGGRPRTNDARGGAPEARTGVRFDAGHAPSGRFATPDEWDALEDDEDAVDGARRDRRQTRR